MKVVFVLVLVLVVVAVPSHGRTESLVTVFNKTQPHESMNNVTVSSSKLEAYTFLYLSMQWPRSFCPNGACRQPVPGRFTVHGLWPQYGQYDPPNPRQFVDCTKTNYPRFRSHQLDPTLVFGLNQYWPNLKTSVVKNYQFWENEYNKHGSCTFSNINDYFYHSLTLAESLGDLALKLSLRRGGPIIPDTLYWPNEIRDAVHEVTFKIPRLVCTRVRNRVLLSEIRFCVRRVPNGIVLVDCFPYTDCFTGNQVVLPWVVIK